MTDASLPIDSQDALLAALFEHMADGVFLLDPETSNILWCNRAAHEDLGLSREDVLNHSVLSLQKDVVGAPQWADIVSAIRAVPCFTFVGRHRHALGHEIPVEVNTTHFSWQGREFFLSVARDISRRVALESDMRDRSSQLWFALNEASDGLWDWDIPTQSVFFSPQLKRMLGYGPHEMDSRLDTWKDNVHPDDAPLVLRTLDEHLRGLRDRYEAIYRLRNRNGHYLWVHDRGKVSERDAEGRPTRVVGMVQNITDQKMLEFQLMQLASNDMLTGLPNRQHGENYLKEQLAACAAQGKKLSLCLFDIDQFKPINDRYGHLVGDEVLRQVGELVRSEVQAPDMGLRWGGDEFVLICPGQGSEYGIAQAERLRQRFASHDWRKQLDIARMPPVTPSLGLATFPDCGQTPQALLHAADLALYQAKSHGRNRLAIARPTEEGCRARAPL
ncbi:MAG: diguanylate cyclase [Halothiobacillaceae bacterium]|jgi:diguanylate cyclase (GGDEF)-like protein/PAS domain S-box-containing protein|nr:diguanylate cyclase [Halothiobacillaceae bacterium]